MDPNAAELLRREKVRVTVRSVAPASGGERRLGVRLAHAEHRPDRPWSYCDLVLRAPAEPPLEPGDAVEVVLCAVAQAARPSDGAAYSCKVRSAATPPPFAVERPGPGLRFVGLVQRDEPPAGGSLLFHMGSGLTCVLDLAPDSGLGAADVRDGEWWEFQLAGEPGVALLERVEDPR